MRDPNHQVWLNDFATRSLRDTADQDYVAARLAHREKLGEPFLWCAHQAIEKYLKAILLFNGRTVFYGNGPRHLGHNLREALKRVQRIKDIRFSIPDNARKFIQYIDDHGPNRYLEVSTSLETLALFHLDYAVWHVRRYCFHMRGRDKRASGTVIKWLPLTRKRVEKALAADMPHKYRIPNGLLEEVLTRKRPGYEALTWRNFCYGRRRKNAVKNVKAFNYGMNPTHIVHPEAFPVLSKHFYFSKEVRDYFAKQLKKKTS